ncbi:P-loop NTPase fold protein [Chryseobacterium sp. ISL-6]|uniref:P-loop NTPase fold protein n=1 Tax=Chryseobacterium sp. ISL-6 TaxID=2819143 RepID=UPI001BEC4208|nr:P-loop NTPase fold protein [Chryseobacterium sp. ISL-6]MBT2619172.1 hypothetical protein [Chryseobacterium sp. ISL-6]
MDNKHIIDYLDYYVKAENINFAILIKGSWGSGKTFFIKKLIEKWSTPNIADDDFIVLSPIYISLNGLNSRKEIIDKLKEKISPFLHSKGVKVATAILKGFIKSTLKIDFDYNKDEKVDSALTLNFDVISIFKQDNDNIKGNRVIIFDDIERCKIPVDEIYGFINDFVEHSKCKIILISDEEKIIEKDKLEKPKYSYLTFKEKVIGKTFEVSPNTDAAIQYFIDQIGSPDIKNLLIKYKDLILKIFVTSEKQNLRVLQRAIFDFERLINLTDPTLKKHLENFEYLFKNFLAYFLIFYLEYNTGNLDINNFQQIFISEGKGNLQNYEEAIKSDNLLHSTKLFSSSELVNYIANGVYEKIVNEINHSIIYNPSEEKNWEKLWYWKYLEDEEFIEILPKVEKDFFESEDLNFPEILHISGILFSLVDNNLYNKSKAEVLTRAKNLISNIKNLHEIIHLNSILHGTLKKSYASENTEEFKELILHFKNCILSQQKQISENYVSDIIYNINEKTIDDLYTVFKQYDNFSRKIYENTPIFKNIDSEKFSEIIINLKNKDIFELKEYFVYRYYPENYSTRIVEDFQKEEINFLKGLKDNLIIKKKNFLDKKLKLQMIENLITEINKIILKLE